MLCFFYPDPSDTVADGWEGDPVRAGDYFLLVSMSPKQTVAEDIWS